MIPVLERLVVLLLVLLMITQVIVPIIFSLPLFFSFRRKTPIDDQLVKAREQKLEVDKFVELMAIKDGIATTAAEQDTLRDICEEKKMQMRRPYTPEPVPAAEPLITPAPARECDSHTPECQCEKCRIGL